MKLSQLLAPTLKEDPADAEVISHKLLVRAGMIRQVARGIYDILPLGLRAVRRVEAIVRDEMNRVGRPGDPHADGVPGGALAGKRTLAAVRARVAAFQGSSRPRLLLRTDPGGGGDGHRPARGAVVSPVAAQPLSDSGEVPGRGAAALRPHARSRVPHEGRLLVPHFRRGLPARVRQHVPSVLQDLHALRPRVPSRGGGHGGHRWLAIARVPGARRIRRRRHSQLPSLRLRGQRRACCGPRRTFDAGSEPRPSAGIDARSTHGRGRERVSRRAGRAIRENPRLRHRRG